MNGYISLENGRVFAAQRFGATGFAAGELVFTTAMTGYLETISDPSYDGQLVIQTFPLIGNVGVIPEDFEGQPALRAYIVRQWCRRPSNFRCEGTLDAFFRERGIVGLHNLDTRALVRLIRRQGAMKAVIDDRPYSAEEVASAPAQRPSVQKVTCHEMIQTGPAAGRRVVLWDFGAKANIERQLIKRGCRVIRVPAQTTAEEIAALHPDGILLSNGPGDPADNTEVIAQIGQCFLRRIPMFGICLGHQLLALSQGATTSKLKFGHRGANQPVREEATGRIFVTSQNHGYTVNDLPKGAIQSYVNCNDGTCEGLEYLDAPVFSVQYHPEAAGGPLDTNFLFDRFISTIGGMR